MFKKILENPIFNIFEFWLQNMNTCAKINLHAQNQTAICNIKGRKMAIYMKMAKF